MPLSNITRDNTLEHYERVAAVSAFLTVEPFSPLIFFSSNFSFERSAVREPAAGGETPSEEIQGRDAMR